MANKTQKLGVTNQNGKREESTLQRKRDISFALIILPPAVIIIKYIFESEFSIQVCKDMF